MGSKWKEITLGQVCVKIGSGATPRGGKDAYRGGNTSLIRSQNIYNERFVSSGLVYIDDSQAHALKNAVVERDDVLLNITGDSVARCCQVDSNVLPARVNQHVLIIRPEPNTLDPRFLRYSLVTREMQARLLALASAGATRNALTKGMIEALTIKAPPLAEQKRIAHILGSLDDKIELNRQMNETLEAMAQALFKDWFVDFGPTRAKMEGKEPYLAPELWELFPDKLGEDGVPEGWEIKSAADFIVFNPSERLAKNTPAPYLGMAALPTSGSTTERPILRKYTSGMRFKNQDTLFARITPCLENGKTAFIQNLPENAIGWGSTEFIVMRSKPELPPAFSYLLARHPEFREHAALSMTGTSGRQRAQLESLKDYPLAQPNTPKLWDEMKSILMAIFDILKNSQEETLGLAQSRDLMLLKLFND